MSPPYRPGQRLAWLSPDGDGIRVQPAIVQTIEPYDETHWRVVTDRGAVVVDDNGEAGRAFPIDVEIARELYAHGGSYVVHATYVDHQQVLDRDHTHEQDSSLDLDGDLGLD